MTTTTRPDESSLELEEAVEVLEDAGKVTFAAAKAVVCSVCKNEALEEKAHLHQEEWIGDECCWDERLRSSE